MKTKYYEMIFDCCETLQNGKERRVKKSVLSPIFREGRHIAEDDRVIKAVGVLRESHFYDIKYVGTKTKTIMFTE